MRAAACLFFVVRSYRAKVRHEQRRRQLIVLENVRVNRQNTFMGIVFFCRRRWWGFVGLVAMVTPDGEFSESLASWWRILVLQIEAYYMPLFS